MRNDGEIVEFQHFRLDRILTIRRTQSTTGRDGVSGSALKPALRPAIGISGSNVVCANRRKVVMPLEPSDESEGDRLRKEHMRAEQRYTRAVSEMNRQRETAHCEDFKKLAQSVLNARIETAEALHDLRLFESEHPKIRPTNI